MHPGELTFGVAAVLFFYVLLRLAASLRVAARAHRRVAEGGIVFALGVPLALFVVPVLREIPARDLRAFVIGSALWVTLAMAFAAFALSRVPDSARGRRV